MNQTKKGLPTNTRLKKYWEVSKIENKITELHEANNNENQRYMNL